MGMPSGGPGDDDDDAPAVLVSEINVTPLVDVMLVLLIIFMVAAPLMVGGVPVNLPRTSAPRTPSQAVEPVVLSLDREGRVYFRDEPVEIGALVARLRPVAQAAPDTAVYVRADGSIPYARVMELMGTVSASGFGRVSLLAESAPVPR